jgi:selenocysteine-specific elongation factor
MRSLVIGTAGHIDHGKSALVEALTGTHPDRLEEERARGITIDLGFAHARIADVDVAFVDVPGHERFIRNMLAGAGGIDAVLLVVAADESVMPQTREHFHICRLLGLSRGAVAITKCDLADVDTVELTALEVRDLVAGSFLEGAPIVPVSARTGAGLDDLRAVLQALAPPAAPQGRPGIVRLPVDRAFSVKGFGTVVTGTLVSGEVVAADELVVLPGRRRVRVRGVQVHGRSVDRAQAPRRAALNLGAAEVTEVPRGVTVASDGTLAVTRRLDARLTVMAGVPPVRHGARVRLHHGTQDVAGRIALAASLDASGQWAPVPVGEGGAAVPAGGTAYVRIRLDHPAVLTRGDRVVLRACSPPRTIAGAILLDPEPPRVGIRRADQLDRFLQIDEAPATGFAERWVRDAGLKGITAEDLVRRGGLDRASAGHVLDRLVSGGAQRVRHLVVDAAAVARLETAVHAALETFHRVHPLEDGMPRETLRETVAPKAADGVFDARVAQMADAGRLTGGVRLALAAHAPAAEPALVRARDAVEREVKRAGLMPPDLGTLAAAAGVDAATAERVCHLLVKERRLVRVGGLIFHPHALATLREDIAALKRETSSVDVSTFKQRYGLSRKFAIPLLEWLDRERVTRRVGDRRMIV